MIPYVLGVFLFITTTICGWIDELDPKGNQRYEQLIDSVAYMTDSTIFKRDENSTLDPLVLAFVNSGIITDTLYEIATDQDQIDNLINATAGLLKGESVLSDFNLGGLNISVNTSDLINEVLDSGIISSTAEYLLMNDTNRDYLSDFAGSLLARKIWLAKILNELGDGSELSVNMIAECIINTPNLNPKYNSSAPQGKKEKIVRPFEQRDLGSLIDTVMKANEGSAQQFLGNLVDGVLSSQLFSTSLNSILGAINDTGVAGPLIMELAHNDTILSLVPKLIHGLYYKNALNFDLNYYFQYAKRHAILADALQWLLTSPKWEPPVGLLLKRMDLKGTFKEIETGLYGPN